MIQENTKTSLSFPVTSTFAVVVDGISGSSLNLVLLVYERIECV